MTNALATRRVCRLVIALFAMFLAAGCGETEPASSDTGPTAPASASEETTKIQAALQLAGATWIAQGPTLTVRFARPERITRVVFSSNRNGGFHRPFAAEYRVEVSADGSGWREVAGSAKHDERARSVNRPFGALARVASLRALDPARSPRLRRH